MFNLTIICLILAGITATFWVVEAAPVYNALTSIKQPKWKEKGILAAFINFFYAICYVLSFIQILKHGKSLIIDVICTVAIVSTFSFGGLIGTAMGFMISNIISTALLIAKIKEKKGVCHA